MTCLVLLGCAVSLALPQGPTLTPAAPTGSLAYPDRPSEMAHVPFVDALGQPAIATDVTIATLDLDGNRIPDAIVLGDAGHGLALHVAMGREHSPGRFRDWPIAPGLASGSFTAAAPLRQAWLDQDTVLLADPNAPQLLRLGFDLGMGVDPHGSGAFSTAAFTVLPPSYGAVDLATGNVEGDGCDDVVVVHDNGSAGFAVIRHALDAPFGVPMLIGSARIDVPWPVRDVALCDFDGDGSGDVVAHVPGLGVAVLRDDLLGNLVPIAAIPAPNVTDLATAPFDATAALAIATPTGVLICWLESATLQYHWLAAAPGHPTHGAALLPRGPAVDVVISAADGRLLRTQTLTRGKLPGPIQDTRPADPAAYVGNHTPCGLASTDVDGDGDVDLLLQHPDGGQWLTLRHEHIAQRPGLVAITQDVSLASFGWYGATYDIAVPASWDLTALPQIELQVMVEHPFTGQQLRWDRRLLPIDPVTRLASFTVQWQDSAQTTANFLNNPALVPLAFAQAGYLTAGGRTQLTFLGTGLGNANYAGAERRTEPLLLHTDPGGNGNKSAQGVVWEKRTAPPLPQADAALLPWQ